jgi:hypothetical protein
MAKGTVGRLNVLVGASIGGLRSGLKGGAKLVSGFASSVRSTLGGLGGLLAGFGLSAVGITAGLKSAAASIDETAKSADRLGISIESFVGLKHAANLASVPVEMLALGLTKMQDNLATAAKSGGPVEKALNSIGLKSKELVNLDSDVAFGRIADGIMSIKNPSERTAAAIDIFSKSGAMMIPMLKEGSAGFTKATAEAKRFGLVFTPTEAANVDAFGDAFDKVGEAIKGGFMQSLIQIAPHLTALVERSSFTLADIGTSIGKFVGKAMTEISFLSSNWGLHWELMKTSTAIQLNKMLAVFVGFFAALYKARQTFINHWEILLADTGNKIPGGPTNKAGGFMASTMAGFGNVQLNPFKSRTDGKNPIDLFREGFNKSKSDIAEGLPGVIKSNADVAAKLWEGVGEAFNKGMEGATDVGLQNKLKELGDQLTKARTEFEAGIENAKPKAADVPGVGPLSDMKKAGVGGLSSQLAAATQLGTTEAASQISASMTAFNRKDAELVDLTKQQNNKLDEIKKAIEEGSEPEFDILPSFA